MSKGGANATGRQPPEATKGSAAEREAFLREASGVTETHGGTAHTSPVGDGASTSRYDPICTKKPATYRREGSLREGAGAVRRLKELGGHRKIVEENRCVKRYNASAFRI